ncbi:hypothetical protein GW915_12785 [bacterium]|nr:hypothetical protein [bacterium]
MKHILLAFMVSSFSSFACDFEFEGVESNAEIDHNFLMVDHVTDSNGDPRVFKRVGIPLNAATKQAMLEKSRSGEAACAFGTFSPISPRVYFLYEIR